LGALLAPVRLTSSALKCYLDDRTKPELPIGFSDEAGRLMADVRYAVEHLDSSIRSLEGLSRAQTTSPACPTAARARGG
jgi:hypothetical protein